ncbi:MAG: hypothetical protein KatS3mg061_0229 [Dehalococcoidia bacterium]|nr:MAG: hypothetical protein KatS3mg061_0229 [Dehalococcoidia bacterium]
MQRIALLLDAAHSARVEAIWLLLHTQFGVPAPNDGAPPHCTLHAAERYDAAVGEVLAELVSTWSPLTLRVEGLGLFTGPRPIVYLAIARGPQLAERQRVLFEQVDHLASGVDPYLAPDRWMPHLTLTRVPLTPAQVGAIVSCLSSEVYQWRAVSSRLALLESGVRTTVVRQLTLSAAWGE